MERGAFHINNQENLLRQTKQEDEKRKTLKSLIRRNDSFTMGYGLLLSFLVYTESKNPKRTMFE